MEGLLAVLIACFHVVIAPIVFAFSIRASRVFLEYLENTPMYPSLDIAIARISFKVQEGQIDPNEAENQLCGFSDSDKKLALNIFNKTDFLRILDVDFEDIEEQMLFCFALAACVSSARSRLFSLD